MKKRWILIGRLHINGKNRWNDWKELSKYLKLKIKEVEDTKALTFIYYNANYIKVKLDWYNKKHNTDFFID